MRPRMFAQIALRAMVATLAALPGCDRSAGSKSDAMRPIATPTESVSADAPASNDPPAMKAPLPDAPRRVLIFSKTAGFRHESIPDGIRCIREIAKGHFEVDATEDPGTFTRENLARYGAVVWLSTTGDVLNESQQQAFEEFIRSGRGYAGIHAASDTEYEWPWYGRLVGAYFNTHPPVQEASNDVEIRDHASTRVLPARWPRTDEWYGFRSNPRSLDGMRVLVTLDETTYQPGASAMGKDHPIAWCHEFEGGRAWYTGGGHTSESFTEPLFRAHLLGGILWSMRADEPARAADALEPTEAPPAANAPSQGAPSPSPSSP